jgi:hypothetical protein
VDGGVKGESETAMVTVTTHYPILSESFRLSNWTVPFDVLQNLSNHQSLLRLQLVGLTIVSAKRDWKGNHRDRCNSLAELENQHL